MSSVPQRLTEPARMKVALDWKSPVTREDIAAGGGAFPEIVTLCGSTRFVDEFNRQQVALTRAGAIVLSIEIMTTQAAHEDPQHVDPEAKKRLDWLHRRKIDLADRVLILNVGGYIGDSTRDEIGYAVATGCPVEYLVAEPISAAEAAERVAVKRAARRTKVGADG